LGLNRIQIGHEEQDLTTTHPAGGRLDHGPDLNVPLQDHAGGGSPDLGVFEGDLRVLQGALRPDQRRGGVRLSQPGVVVLLLGDGLGLEERFRPAELGLGVAELGLRHLEVRLCLGQGAPRKPLVHPDQEVAAGHGVAGFNPHVEDLTRCLGLDLDDEDGLDGARRTGGHRDVSGSDGNQLIHRLFDHLRTPYGHDRHGREECSHIYSSASCYLEWDQPAVERTEYARAVADVAGEEVIDRGLRYEAEHAEEPPLRVGDPANTPVALNVHLTITKFLRISRCCRGRYSRSPVGRPRRRTK
jgi:hypothetical protein